MAEARGVRIGERFKSAARTVFGHPSGDVFEVRDFRVDGCIVPDAKLFNVANPSDQRLISVDALRDTNLYISVELQSIEFHGRLTDSWQL